MTTQGALAAHVDEDTLDKLHEQSNITDNHTMMDNHMDHENSHDPDSPLHGEHNAVFDLVPHSDATHMAVNNGSWFDANTWASGEVPGNDAHVVIQHGVIVDYDGVSDARIFTVRVDGSLNFATDTDSQMVIDTMVVDPNGELIIGTAETPVQDGVNVDIIIVNNGDIDVSWDPGLLSRGIITHGHVEMHGQEKTTHLKVLDDPMVGDTSITLSETPEGWQVGDTIVLAGTHYDGYKWDNTVRDVIHHESEDEVLTITEIDGNVVHFGTPLEHNHDAPRADLKTSVANYTRNISIESEDGAASEVHHRGHVMFMHNDDVESPAIAEGNAVFGSPGWGYVHHDSNAIMHDNASYNTFGAGFVAETGNEIGEWSNNIAIYAQGVAWGSPKNINDVGNFDMGKDGSGFYFQGRMVEAFDNVAASTNSGFTYFHRGRYEDSETGLDGNIQFDASIFSLPEALGLNPQENVDDAPILNFKGNESFASNYGFFVEKANPNQEHDVRTVLEDFTAWDVVTGAHLAYTSHYLLKGFDVTGTETRAFRSARDGIEIGINASDVTVVDAKIDGFNIGIDVQDRFTGNSNGLFDLKQHFIVDAIITNSTNDYNDFNPEVVTFLTSDDLVEGRFNVDLSGRNDDGYLVYQDVSHLDPDSRHVAINGTKTDSLGEIVLSAGTDNYNAGFSEVIRLLEQEGYYSANGNNYFLLEDYYSDRVTGEIFKHVEIVQIHESVRLGNQYSSYRDAKYNGEIDLDSIAPDVENDHALTELEADVIINVLSNDFDPDGDALRVDGIVQPIYGQVFDNGDGTITYRPGLEFTGTVSFKYWATDGNGHYTSGFITVDVVESVNVVNEVLGTTGADRLVGTDGQDNIEGLSGNDRLYGYAGDDTLSGDEGDDKIIAGDGDDTLYGGFGNDSLVGDLGQDILHGNAGADYLYGGLGRDILHGGEDRDSLHGGDDVDMLYGGDGQDFLYGSNDADFLYGEDGNDGLRGEGGNDTLSGGGGNDRLLGGDGDDTLIGGADHDYLYGQGGADVFVLDTVSIDRVRDFDLSEGDRLDISDVLTGFDANMDDLNDFVDLVIRSAERVDVHVSEDGSGDDYQIFGIVYGDLSGETVDTLFARGAFVI